MFYYLADGDPEIDGMMRSVCEIGGGGRKLTDFAISLRDWPETKERAEASVETAKRAPRNPRHRRTKTFIYRVQYNWFRKHFERNPDAIAVAWNGLTGTRRAYMAAAEDAGRGRIFMERSPLPGRVTVDPRGINQLNSLPRDGQFYLDWAAGDPVRRGKGWMALKERLTARKATKRADVGQSGDASALARRNFIFCPLQVPDDTQIRQFSGWVGSIESFIATIAQSCEHLPEGWHLRFKEHPSAKIPLGTVLDAAIAAHPGRIIIDNQTDTFRQVEASRAVITLNSSVGLQAFYFNRPVIVLGEAFFRLPGLVTPVDSAADLAHVYAGAETLGFDAPLRDAYMNYLDQVYYPKVEPGADGAMKVEPERVLPKIEAARKSAKA